MKTKTTMMMVVAFLMMTGLTFAGESATNLAKKNLQQEISQCFKQEMSDWNNFFYKNGINKIKEEVRVSFWVNEDQTVSLIRVISDNPDAKNYVKHVFETNSLEADQLLAGKAYTFNLNLRYEAH